MTFLNPNVPFLAFFMGPDFQRFAGLFSFFTQKEVSINLESNMEICFVKIYSVAMFILAY